jgi:hypothetical protein
VCCFTAFYFLNKTQAENNESLGINVGLGWIFWLGIFTIIAPVFLSDATKKTLYNREYFSGLILFALANIAIPILCTMVTASMFET